MKTFDLVILENKVSITTDGEGGGSIESGLPREVCPSCTSPDCCHHCDGSQGSDENNEETEGDTANRLKFNGFLDGMEGYLLSLACAGVDLNDPRFAQAAASALEAAGNALN